MPTTNACNLAFIAVGANIEPEHNILLAAQRLAEMELFRATSTLYQTEPLGKPDQPLFLNGVWLIETKRAPGDIKTNCLSDIESKLGRVRTTDKYAARPIDLDLILYNDIHCQSADLELPHPDLDRPFVHQPLAEILAAHPGLPYEQCWRALLASYCSLSPCGIPQAEITKQLQQWVSPP
jgi:2-amino-4-hydroxy-6-hydroxymethyldihydropteridine diphosphokinase